MIPVCCSVFHEYLEIHIWWNCVCSLIWVLMILLIQKFAQRVTALLWNVQSVVHTCHYISKMSEMQCHGNTGLSHGFVKQLWKFLYFSIITLRQRQNGCHFPDDIFKCSFLNKNVPIAIKISLKFVPKGPMNNIQALIQIMAWRRPVDKPLSEPMMVSLPMHICINRPQWVEYYFDTVPPKSLSFLTNIFFDFNIHILMQPEMCSLTSCHFPVSFVGPLIVLHL